MNAITRFFKKLAAAFSGFMAGPGGKIVQDALAGILQEVGSVAAGILLEEAKTRVGLIDHVDGAPGDKAAHVQDYMKAYAARVGIEASQSLINYTVETAVRSLRKQPEV